MHTPLFVGLLMSLAAAFVLAGAFFIQAWWYRRNDSEYLLFGVMTLFLSAYAGSVGLAYYTTSSELPCSLEDIIDVTISAGIGALALVVHFALRYERVRHEARFMCVVYGLATLFLIVVLTGHWWATAPTVFPEYDFWGFEITLIHLEVTPVAFVFHALVPIGVCSVSLLLFRGLRAGRRDGHAAFLGSLVLAITGINDGVALGTGWYDTVSLLPIGFVAFSYGVSMTLVSRYGRTSNELEAQAVVLRRRTEQLDTSMGELERAQQELVKSEQLAAVGELAAVIAHEVRNPLAIVNNAVASLRKEGTSHDDRQRLLAIIEEETGRLETLVSHVLTYARPVTPQQAPLDLRELLERTLTVADEFPDVVKRVDVDPDLPEVSGDAILLRLAFENVVLNAVQAMRGVGKLSVHVASRHVRGVDAVAVDFADG